MDFKFTRKFKNISSVVFVNILVPDPEHINDIDFCLWSKRKWKICLGPWQITKKIEPRSNPSIVFFLMQWFWNEICRRSQHAKSKTSKAMAMHRQGRPWNDSQKSILLGVRQFQRIHFFGWRVHSFWLQRLYRYLQQVQGLENLHARYFLFRTLI